MYAEFYRWKCFVEGAGDFSGIEPEKSLGEHPSGFSPNPIPLGEKLLFFPQTPFSAFERVLPRFARSNAASPRVPPAA